MYAKVIVDVPAKQTNRAFDYEVPSSLRKWVEVGSRVGVPFGPRVLQGFVVELQENTQLDVKRIKPIQNVLDLVPPLTDELVMLGRWISHMYLCHEVTALQAMLPAALKAKYERAIGVGEESGEQSLLDMPDLQAIVAYVKSKGSVPMDALLERFAAEGALIKQLLGAGILTEVQVVKDRMSTKKALTVFPPAGGSGLEQALSELPASQ